jgi:hypothetical protein
MEKESLFGKMEIIIKENGLMDYSKKIRIKFIKVYFLTIKINF